MNNQKHRKNTVETAPYQPIVEALRQQIATAELERTREREQLTDRIESLQQMLADEKSERRQLNVLLTDQREKSSEPPHKGLWARLVG